MKSTSLRWTIALCCLALVTSASAHPSSELPSVFTPRPAAEPDAVPSNHTNETPPPTNNSTYVPPPTMTPTRQNVSSRWDEPAPFEVVVGNPANATATRTVYLSGQAPPGWSLWFEKTNLTLAPGESATVRGEVELDAPLLGGAGTVSLRASASGRTAQAFVDVCFEGLVQSCDNATAHRTTPRI